jgi:hypothetical protein
MMSGLQSLAQQWGVVFLYPAEGELRFLSAIQVSLLEGNTIV